MRSLKELILRSIKVSHNLILLLCGDEDKDGVRPCTKFLFDRRNDVKSMYSLSDGRSQYCYTFHDFFQFEMIFCINLYIFMYIYSTFNMFLIDFIYRL